MSDLRNTAYNPASVAGQSAALYDEGLRTFMLKVYNYMAIGVAITGLAALGAATSGLTQTLFSTPLKWVVIFAPLAFVFLLGMRINSMSPAAAQIAFWAFSAVMGLSISQIFFVFTGESIVRVFFISAAAFGALSLYGYTAKKSLSGWGSFLFMGMIGLLIAGIVNLFLQSSAMQFAISALTVLVFAGMTAYDTQRLKEMYLYELSQSDAAVATRGAVMGALSLYMDFINIFMSLLNLLGNRE